MSGSTLLNPRNFKLGNGQWTRHECSSASGSSAWRRKFPIRRAAPYTSGNLRSSNMAAIAGSTCTSRRCPLRLSFKSHGDRPLRYQAASIDKSDICTTFSFVHVEFRFLSGPTTYWALTKNVGISNSQPLSIRISTVKAMLLLMTIRVGAFGIRSMANGNDNPAHNCHIPVKHYLRSMHCSLNHDTALLFYRAGRSAE